MVAAIPHPSKMVSMQSFRQSDGFRAFGMPLRDLEVTRHGLLDLELAEDLVCLSIIISTLNCSVISDHLARRGYWARISRANIPECVLQSCRLILKPCRALSRSDGLDIILG